MFQNQILKQMEENKRNLKLGGETFNTPLPGNNIKEGKPVKEIVKEMKKASQENLIRESGEHASFY